MDNIETKKQISLVKHTDTYKLVIPADVEKKIRHLCNRISQVEWSGTLFYTFSGSYEEGTLEIRCVDIFPMDIGSASYTEFDMSPDVIAYMTDHPELLDCQMGLIHSHNNMATFFSGTDTATLREEGNDRNHFVSLIVNNAGTYTAAITRKLTIKNTISSTYTYRSFDDIEKTGTKTDEVEEEVIEYNYLDIIKEGEVVEPFLEIDQRLEAIKASKIKEVPAKTTLPTDSYICRSSSCIQREIDKPFKPIQQSTLFDKDDFFMESEPPRTINNEVTETDVDISIPAEIVRSISLQLITGSIAIADASRIDPNKWSNQMVKLFDKRFDGDVPLFSLWAEQMAEFVLTNFIPNEYSQFEEEYVSELAQAVYLTLDKLPSNKYIKAIQYALITWMK